jgi:Xaa-Pro aminopeptidase
MRIADACKPGATGADLVEAYARSGEALPSFPIVYSVGLGYEGAIAGSALGPAFDAQRKLEPGMVLGVQAGIEGRSGAYFALETVHVTPDGHEVISTMGHGPLTGS